MSKITKKELKKQLDGVQNRFAALVKDLKASGYICESVYAPFAHDYQEEQSDYDALITILDSKEPQLKQLDQSVFDGLDEKWRFAAFNTPSNSPILFSAKPHESMYGKWYAVLDCDEYMTLDELEGVYEYTDDWQNSLIERDAAKELLEVDLSSELTGSELCRAMLARGDKYVMCGVSDVSDLDAASNEYDDLISDAVTDFDDTDGLFGTASMRWIYAVPINNQGEPLTASEVGL